MINESFNDYAVKYEEKTCIKHNKYNASLLQFGSISVWTSCPHCYQENLIKNQAQEVKQQKEKAQLLFEQQIEKISIPPRFKQCNFDNYVVNNKLQNKVKNTLIEFAKNINANLKIGKNIILSGNVGTGKTHLSIATAKEAVNQGYTAFFTNMYEMIDRINSYGWEKYEILQKYIEPDLLILDEICALNNDEQKNLNKIINYRYEQIKSTIIQTNLTISELIDVLGKRIFDRLCSNDSLILELNWESFRK